jgi:pyrroloquinoline quinone biosynthesis protein B
VSKVLVTLLVALACAGCSATAESATENPYVIVLGSAQDGGLPQIGCDAPCCERARRDPAARRFASSLVLVDPRDGRRWLFDAGPDLREQYELVPARAGDGPRPALFDGVFLTHAHVGHYLGLAQLGREVYGARGVPVFVSPRMARFLAGNGPWSLLVDTHAIELREIEAGATLELGRDLAVTALVVPHRDEFSDTLAFVIRGPRRALLYVPDIDKWERWDQRLEDVLATVDFALVDATFFDGGELPGRDLSEIPHPFVVDTLAGLERASPELLQRVVFTHLNHTNPLADPTSAAARQVRDARARVASEGQRYEL